MESSGDLVGLLFIRYLLWSLSYLVKIQKLFVDKMTPQNFEPHENYYIYGIYPTKLCTYIVSWDTWEFYTLPIYLNPVILGTPWNSWEMPSWESYVSILRQHLSDAMCILLLNGTVLEIIRQNMALICLGQHLLIP